MHGEPARLINHIQSHGKKEYLIMSLCFGYILGMFRSGLHPKPSGKKLAPEHDTDM